MSSLLRSEAKELAPGATMTRDVGLTDRYLRVLAGIILLGIAIFQPGTGYDWPGWIGLVPLLTGLSGWCPGYSLIGFISRGDRARGV